MSDDWRLRIDLHDKGHARELAERLQSPELEHDLDQAFHDRVAVSVDGPEVFLYAGSREQAERAESAVRRLASEHGWALESELKHWHPTAEEWEDPDKSLPDSDAARAAERRELMESEREESTAQGYPEFEVRVELQRHRDTMHLADQLREEGLPSVHRWKYLFIGALDEDTANALAERLRKEAPPDAAVTVEATSNVVVNERPSNPFAILGGLGG
jgi:hypothetical protein